MNREGFFKLLRHSMFMDEFKTIVRMSGELTEHIDAASEEVLMDWLDVRMVR